jgi:SpoVK/Ycf46/Vps4 family AAA+-type ATPase
VDALLSHRTDSERKTSIIAKTLFMQLWQGLRTDSSANIVLLAATNRIAALDDAARRRCHL